MNTKPLQLDVNEQIECAHTLASKFYTDTFKVLSSVDKNNCPPSKGARGLSLNSRCYERTVAAINLHFAPPSYGWAGAGVGAGLAGAGVAAPGFFG
jgi:hypothetical protein